MNFLKALTEMVDLSSIPTALLLADHVYESYNNLVYIQKKYVQALPGGEKEAAKEWDTEFLHYLPYIKDDDFLGVQCYTRKRYDANGLMPYENNIKLSQMGYEIYPDAISGAVREVAKSFKDNILITENGIATDDAKERILFIDISFLSF